MLKFQRILRLLFHTEYKDDDSPVTEADKTSDVLIRNILLCKNEVIFLKIFE